MSEAATPDSQRLHFLESEASPAVRSLIRSEADRIAELLTRPGMGGLDNCRAASIFWKQAFDRSAIRCDFLGTALEVNFKEGGGYRTPDGEVVDHQFLMVGDELALFDPTALLATIGHHEWLSLDPYIVSDGRTFPEWRTAQLVSR